MATRSSRNTIDDVARRAGVSVATVSRALRGLPNVSPTTRQLVEKAAADLSYTVDARASSLASGRTHTIGLVAPWFDSWYESKVISGLEGILAPAGYDLLVYAIKTSVRPLPILRERVRNRTVDGIISIDVFFDEEDSPGLEAFGVPIVLIGSRLSVAHSLNIDNHQGAGLATSHLLELGHRRILYVGGAQSMEMVSPVSSVREEGVRAAIREAGLDDRETLEISRDGAFSIAGGTKVMQWLLEREEKMPTGIVCGSDEIAMGLMAEARRNGVDVPGDVSVVGFDDHDLADVLGVTTIRQSVYQHGEIAGRLMLDTLADGNQADFQHLEREVELVVRTSTDKPPSN